MYALQRVNRGLPPVVLAFLTTLPMLLLSAAIDAASFDCSLATSSSEKAICSDRYLSELDESLSKIYTSLLPEYPDLKQSQRQWLKLRNTCQNRDCLVSAHHARIEELFRKKYGGEQVCSQLNRLVQNEGVRALTKKHNEQELGMLCGYQTKWGKEAIECGDNKQHFNIARLGEMGLDIANETRLRDFITDSSYNNYLSVVDINNDGLPDLRFSSSRGTLGCEYNLYFYGTLDRKYRSTEGSEIGDYLAGGDGAFCGTDNNITLKEENVTYVLSLNIRESHIGTLYRGTENGSLARLCEITATPAASNNHTARAASISAADEKALLQDSIRAIIEFEKPHKFAVLDESLSSEDLLTPKLPRHHPEHQFSNGVEGVSRDLEQALLDNNTRPASMIEKLLQESTPDDFKKLKVNAASVNLGMLDNRQFAIEEAKHFSTPASRLYLMIFKFSRPAILGNKALVYAESKFISTEDKPQYDARGEVLSPPGIASGHAFLFKRENGKWSLIQTREMWSGGSPFTPHP